MSEIQDGISDRDIALAMVTFGGSFVAALGAAWTRADAVNAEKIKAAFPEYWEQYRDLVQLRDRAREAK
jgi:hypothetical protein